MMRSCRKFGIAGLAAMACMMTPQAGSFAQEPPARESVPPRSARDGSPNTSLPIPGDEALRDRVRARESDWRNGPIVYQVIVDRFAPPADPTSKKALYPAPRVLHQWTDEPRSGRHLPEAGLWSHELDFWGGDLPGLEARIGHVQAVGAEVLYLNPIHAAFTNHKYDAQDFASVSAEYGTRENVIRLAKVCHERGIKLMLDGVFNHMGKTSPRFRSAMSDPKSRDREWFVIDPKYRHGYRAWADVANLPELNLENDAVREHLWNGPDSVVAGYLRDGVDGWRIDVAYDLGFHYLSELTTAAHAAKSGSWVVGEVWNYPEDWSPSLDGVMNFSLRQSIFDLIDGKISARLAATNVERMVADCGLDPLLKSWIPLDNHDTKRLKTRLRDEAKRRMAQVLQFTLPGAPVIYYGTELGMEGGDDPANRAPMRWELVNEENRDLSWMKSLVRLRKQSRALRVGDFRRLDTEELFAFSRRTERVGENVIVVVNPTDRPLSEVIVTRESRLMSGCELRDQLDPKVNTGVFAGRIEVTLPARTARVFMPVLPDAGTTYSPFKRVP